MKKKTKIILSILFVVFCCALGFPELKNYEQDGKFYINGINQEVTKENTVKRNKITGKVENKITEKN